MAKMRTQIGGIYLRVWLSTRCRQELMSKHQAVDLYRGSALSSMELIGHLLHIIGGRSVMQTSYGLILFGFIYNDIDCIFMQYCFQIEWIKITLKLAANLKCT